MSPKRIPILPYARRAVVTASLACLVGTAGAFTVPATASAAPSDDLSAQLEEAQQRLVDLTSQLEVAQSLVDTTTLDLEDTQSRIDNLEGEVADAEQRLGEAQSELSRHVVSSYKSGGISLVDLLLSSSSFSDLVSQVFYANRIVSAENARVEEVSGIQQQLQASKGELVAKQQELTDLLAQQSASKDELASAVAETESYIDGLSDDLREALDAERVAAAAEAAANGANDAAGGGDTGSAAYGGADSDDGTTQAPEETPTSPEAPATQPSTPETPTQTPSTDGGSTSGGASSGNLSQSQRSTIVSAATSQVGLAYSYGACSPGVAFDCSGLTMWAYGRAGISLSHSSAAQYRTVVSAGNLKTDASQLVAGDLVFYQTGGNIRHVGIYIGGGQVCHASDYSVGIVITSISYSPGFCGGGSPV